jgi:hypothetical protein
MGLSKKTRPSFSVSPEAYQLAHKYAPLVGENPSAFVTQCIFENCNALESDEMLYDFPVLQRWRAVLGKSTLVSRIFRQICALAEPDNIEEIKQEHWKYMLQLLDEHEKEQKGPVDPETRKLYWNQAIEMNKLRIAREKQLAKIKAKEKTK